MSRHHRNIENRREYETIRPLALERDSYRCRECGKAGRFEVHHIRPLEKGGGNELGNLLTLCVDCHIRKHKPSLPKTKYATSKWRDLVLELT